MIKLLYSNINEIDDGQIEAYSNILPTAIKRDIIKYKYAVDRKSRLLARLMLLHCMEKNNAGNLLHNWCKDSNHKPVIRGWRPFSISHSGQIVVFCYADDPVGIDIEAKKEVEYAELISYFHPEEQEFILRSKDLQTTFYNIWVKKEAILKAFGVGIVNGLAAFSCIHDHVTYQGVTWYFHEIYLCPDYTCYVCTADKCTTIAIEHFKMIDNLDRIC